MRLPPLLCEHSERKVINNERLEKVIISAVKQSIKAYVPKLNALTPYKQFIQSQNPENTYMAHCQRKGLNHLKNQISSSNKFTILIGPEGDFSPEEINKAIQLNINEISLGNSRLRTETARDCSLVK